MTVCRRIGWVGNDLAVMEGLSRSASGQDWEWLGMGAEEAIRRLQIGDLAVDLLVLDPDGDPSVHETLPLLARFDGPLAVLLDGEDMPLLEACLNSGVSACLLKPVEVPMLAAAWTPVKGRAGTPGRVCFPFRDLHQIAVLSHLVAGLCPDPAAVQIALSELMLNAVEHGNLGLGYERKGELMLSGGWRNELERMLASPEHASRFALLTMEWRGGVPAFTVQDEGKGFDPSPYLSLDPSRIMDLHGRGIAIARLLGFPGLAYRDEGRTAYGMALLR